MKLPGIVGPHATRCARRETAICVHYEHTSAIRRTTCDNLSPRRGLRVMASQKQTIVTAPQGNCNEKEAWQEEEDSENDDKEVGREQA